MLYLDTSAFLKLYIRESGSEIVQDIVTGQSDPLPTGEILEMELLNAFRLKVFWNELAGEEAVRLAGLFGRRKTRGLYFVPDLNRAALMADFRDLSLHTAELGCRTLDILHVACARQLEPASFVSFDQRQRSLASAVGIHVLPDEI